MMRLLETVHCAILRRCPPLRGHALVEKTKTLMAEVDKEWSPIRERIAREERQRPDLAAALREARRQVGRPARDRDGGAL